jgi:hypothetical protein
VTRASRVSDQRASAFGTVTKVFKDATLFFSRSPPNLAMVIPAMDHIDECLTNDSLNENYEVSIRVATGLSKKVLNRYYSKTDQSELYRITMGADAFF